MRASEYATLVLIGHALGHAYIGNRGAKDLLELVFRERTESEWTCDGSCVTRDQGGSGQRRYVTDTTLATDAKLPSNTESRYRSPARDQ